MATTTSSEAGDDTLRLEQSLSPTGVPEAVVRDTQGRIAYAGPVPQSTQSPTEEFPRDDVPKRRHDSAASETKSTAPAAAAIEIPQRQRPSIAAKALTEAPRPARQFSNIPPTMQRTGTNVSLLQHALWQYAGDGESSSSDDSSDEEGGIDRSDQAKRKAVQRSQTQDDHFRKFRVGNENYKTKGKVSKRDGRLAISVNETKNKGYLAKALGTAAKHIVPLDKIHDQTEGLDKRPEGRRLSSATTATPTDFDCPKLNIVIMVIGSRGDAQPFLKIGKVLHEQYGHRVRFATHPAFRDFVEKDTGLEFFSVGGDPSELMAFMVKNPGLVPTVKSVREGDIGKRRQAMAEMFDGFWRACVNDRDDEKNVRNKKMMQKTDPFVADAIIANPPSFAHIHCAEALGIPLHLMFTMPYTPTQAFPHPLASIKRSNVDPGYTNFISYPLVEMMVWQGLGDLVNDFRRDTLGLDPVSTLWAPGATYRLHVPFTYMWSPSLVPKPRDWGEEVDISGFVFLELASSFKPPDPLVEFMKAGEAPIYIGFGSIVVDDPEKFTEMIFEAVKLAGVRALVSKGWGGLGGNDIAPDNVFMLENTPHDWLFPQVKACVIHGGAGTTAISLKCGRPTMIVPFFGDQFFWGSMVGNAGAGPEPVPYKMLTAERLAEGIKHCLTEEAQEAAAGMAKSITTEGDGAENACLAFHKHLILSGKHSMRCSLLDERIATWWLRGTSLRLSAVAAFILVRGGQLSGRSLKLIRHNEWNDFEGPGEPITGIAGSLVGTAGRVFTGVGGMPARMHKTTNKRRERKVRRQKRAEAKAKAAEAIEANGTDNEASGGRPIATRTATGATDVTGVDEGYTHDVEKSLARSAKALATAPTDLALALAQGFHNAPRLYGDNTVRRPKRVTGMKSGLNAARYEFAYGIYDAWTGIVRLPVRGARKSGATGFVKGIGMGSMGFVLKNISALLSPIGYTMKGVKKQVERHRSPYGTIKRARIRQGQVDFEELHSNERKDVTEKVLKGWKVMKSLWKAVEHQAGEKGGITSKLDARRHRAAGDAFESVEMAESALKAVNNGEDAHKAVKELKQHSEDQDAKDRQAADKFKVTSAEERGTLPENPEADEAGAEADAINTEVQATIDAGQSPASQKNMANEDRSWENLVNGRA